MLDLNTVQAIYDTFRASAVATVALNGVKVLAIGLALVNILKKYNEGLGDTNAPSWGLTPSELLKNFAIVVLVIFGDSVLAMFDNLLVSIEGEFGASAPQILSLNDVQSELEEAPTGLPGLVYMLAKIMTPLFAANIVAGILGFAIWFMDLFIYAFFLVERFFLLGLLQVFFPVVITFAVYDKLRPLAYSFMKLYIAVYLLVPCFMLVNLFANNLYTELQTNWINNFLGIPLNNIVFQQMTAVSAMTFVFLVKLKLYKKSVSFMFRLFTSS